MRGALLVVTMFAVAAFGAAQPAESSYLASDEPGRGISGLFAAAAGTRHVTLQGDPTHPLWDALRSRGGEQGMGPAEWATAMTTDADRNGRTDFLDIVAQLASASGLGDTLVEVLVRGDPETHPAVQEALIDAEPIEAVQAVFGTIAVRDLHLLHDAGAGLVAWEPRAFVAASTNPAGGSPSGMDQSVMHQAGTAWGAGYTGDGVRLAVLDTGADDGHEALDGGKIVAFEDCINGLTSPYDDHGHGTHVASTAAGDDGTDFRGVAWGADLVIVKTLDSTGSGSLADFECGIDFVTSGGGGAATAQVASMSAGLAVPPLGITTLNGGEFDVFGWDSVAAEPATKRHMPFLVAAGNWVGTVLELIGVDETTRIGVNGVNQVSSPGFANEVITVGAVDRTQSPATFTAIGPGKALGNRFKPDVMGMGVATWGALEGTTSWYERWSGTSMATPLAAGAVALLVEKDNTKTWSQYRLALRLGAGPSCILGASPTSCDLAQPSNPNFVDGWGVVKGNDSLALI